MSRRLTHSLQQPARRTVRSLGLETLEDRSVPSGFSDDFEGSALNPFWQTATSSGNVIFPSTVQAHSGNQSVQLSTYMSSAHKGINVLHTFDTPRYGATSIWVYDTGAGVASSNAFYFNIYNPDRGIAQWGTWDYDFRRTEDNYRFGYSDYDTNSNGNFYMPFNRSQGWHLWSIEAVPNQLRFSIDGQPVQSVPVDLPFTRILFGEGAPNWRPAWTSYWDDFEFTEYAQTDLVADSFRVGPQGLEFSYSVNDANLPQATNAAIYWANGPTWEDRLGGPVTQVPLQTQQGHYGPVTVPKMNLGAMPSGATHLLLMLDPTNQIGETDETNNLLSLSLYGGGGARAGSPNSNLPASDPKLGAIDRPTARATVLPPAQRATLTIAAPTEWAAPSKPLRSVELPATPPADPFELHGVALAE